MSKDNVDKCPNCLLRETGSYLARSAQEMSLAPNTKPKFCFECSCIFITFDFDEMLEGTVSMQ